MSRSAQVPIEDKANTAHFEDIEKTRSITSENTQTPVPVRGLDAAMEFLAANGGSGEDVTEAESNRVRRKVGFCRGWSRLRRCIRLMVGSVQIDTRLLPMMMMIYFYQQLDKSTLANTSLFGLRTDTGLGRWTNLAYKVLDS
jgi:hypothetical protein